MNEDAAREWIRERDVPRETIEQLEKLSALVADENARQNLIAPSTVPSIWSRHIADSVQLLDHAPRAGSWVDIGSGAGFPGLVIAIVGARPVTLIEPRAKRADFLARTADALDIVEGVTVVAARAETWSGDHFDIVTARAVTALADLFAMARALADPGSHWILPKGRGAAEELERARVSWQGDFALVPSVTDAQASIVLATQVRPRRGR